MIERDVFILLQRVVLAFSFALQQNHILHLRVLKLRERMCLDFKSTPLQSNRAEKNHGSSHFLPGMNTATAIGNESLGGSSVLNSMFCQREVISFHKNREEVQKSCWQWKAKIYALLYFFFDVRYRWKFEFSFLRPIFLAEPNYISVQYIKFSLLKVFL